MIISLLNIEELEEGLEVFSLMMLIHGIRTVLWNFRENAEKLLLIVIQQ